jgi:Cu(I)/Ag(I) efflux system membrane fusion protein
VKTSISRLRPLLPGALVFVTALVLFVVFRRPLIAWFTGQPLNESAGQSVTARAGPFAIDARLAPDPPRQNRQVLELTVRDAAGTPVDDATVDVAYDMPAMGSMAEMKGAARVTHGGAGVYRAQFDLPMGGTWGLRATVRAGSRSASQGFQLTVGSVGLTRTGGAGGDQAPPAGHRALAPVAYPPMAFDALRSTMDAYERIRTKLAGDDTQAVSSDAHTIADALRAVHDALPPGRDDLSDATTGAREAAEHLAAMKAIDDMRSGFAALSRSLLPLIGADSRLTAGWQVFECPMFEDHPRWMQHASAPDNPFMGSKMPSCGTAASWQAPAPSEGPAAGAGTIDHYTCSMHPSVRQAGPGKCPICGMDLIPVTREQQEQGVVMIDEGRRQLIGVRTEPVVAAPMRMTFRAVGHVTYDESALSDVNLKVRGWITKLYVSQTGQRVSKGQPLFAMYSPELYNAEQDFLVGLHGAAGTGLLANAARQRLHLLGLTESQIDAVAQSGKPSEDLAIASPATGFIIEKNVVEGASVDAGMRLYRIASLSKVWVDADVYESDLAHVRVGQLATVTLDYLPGHAYEAKVAYVYPYLDPAVRTGRVRLELANNELDLRPGMYTTVDLSSDLGNRVQVPAAAVVYTGPRRLVFVDVGGGRFRPTEVQVGTASNGMYEVLSGLSPGEQVATSGVFLIAAEARISSAAKYWDTTVEADAGEVETAPAAPEHAPTPPVPTRSPAPSPKHLAPPQAPASVAPSAPEKDFTCPMHLDVHSHEPGKCPKCGMDLVPAPRQP